MLSRYFKNIILVVIVLALGMASGAHAASLKDTTVAGDLTVTGEISGDASGLTGIPGAVSGLGAGYVPVASNATTLIDSGIYQDANGNVGIGSFAPQAKLDVEGSVYFGNGNVGVGVANPSYQFTVASNLSSETTRGITILQGASSASAANLNFRKSRGTFSSPQSVTNGDYINMTAFHVYTNVWQIPATFGSIVDGTVSNGVNPASVFFSTGTGNEGYNPFTNNSVRLYLRPDGSVGIGGSMGTTGSLAGAKMVIDSVGNVGIGTTVPRGKLEVDGNVYIMSSGNLGIGTVIPRAALDVDGAVYLTQKSAPAITTNQMYNVSGNLYWGSSPVAMGTSLTWTMITASQTMSVNNGYIANSGSEVVLTIPTTVSTGDIFAVAGAGSGGWQIQASGTQVVRFGSGATSAGGTLDSTKQFDSVQILCIDEASGTDAVFSVIASQGNIDLN